MALGFADTPHANSVVSPSNSSLVGNSYSRFVRLTVLAFVMDESCAALNRVAIFND